MNSNMNQIPGILTALAELPHDTLLTVNALARLLGRCEKTIARAVNRGELPPPIRFLGKRQWVVGTILEHLRGMQETAIRQSKDDRRKLARHDP